MIFAAHAGTITGGRGLSGKKISLVREIPSMADDYFISKQ
jgi:hypothetical protein